MKTDKIFDRLKKILGFNKESAYVNEHLREANVRSTVYISAVLIAVEIWMLIRYTLKYVITGMCETIWVFFNYTYPYWILLSAGLFVFIYCLLFLTGRINKAKKYSNTIIMLFGLLCLYFGISTSLSDFSRGRMVTCFLTMALYVACLLIWKPYTILLMQPAIATLFIHIIKNYAFNKQGELVVMNEGDQINYITYFISLTMVAMSIYYQRYSEAKQSESLEIAAITDEETGAPNMYRFSQQAKEVLENSDVSKYIYLFFNIKNFATYSDRYGYMGGIELLKKMSGLIKEVFKDEPYARESRDHFVVLTKVEGHENRISEIRNRFLELIKGEVYLDVKAGTYRPKNAEADPRLEINNAHYAVGLIENHDEQYIKEYDEKIDKDYHLRQYVLNNIDKAVKEGYIQVYYQPVVWSTDGELCGCEALARWIDPEVGFLSPGTFIPVLEESRQIHKLDKCIYETVCRKIRECLDNNLPVFPISLNFSRLDFELMDAVGELESLVTKYNVPRDYIHVEVTESSISQDVEKLQQSMKLLHEKGYSIWLDDFGSGYSSLNVLKDYDFDLLKIDMVFLKNFSAQNKNAQMIIKSILDLAKELNMMTLSEGVETKDAVDFLQKAGCGRLQGYYYGKPMTYDEILAKIKDGSFHLSKKFI